MCSTHQERKNSFNLAGVHRARLKILEALRCSIMLSEAYFEAFGYKSECKKKYSRSKFRGSAHVLRHVWIRHCPYELQSVY